MRLPVVLVLASIGAMTACSLLVDTSGYAGGNSVTTDAADAGAGDAGAALDAGPGCGDAGADPSLVLYLPFDETGGTKATDCSGRGHDGQIVGAGATRGPGQVGGALVLDGTDGCVALGQPSDLVLTGAFTVAAWVRVDQFATAASESRQIIAKTTRPSDRGWRFVTDNPDTSAIVSLKIGTSAGVTFGVDSPKPQPLRKWIHAASVWVPGTRGEIYVDGLLVTSVTASVPTITEDPTASVYVGCLKPGTLGFDGAIDELRVYSRALQASEIAALAR